MPDRLTTPRTAEDVCRILQPLFDIGEVAGLNGPTGRLLAELIQPRDAADLTVREVLALLEQVSAEINAAFASGELR